MVNPVTGVLLQIRHHSFSCAKKFGFAVCRCAGQGNERSLQLSSKCSLGWALLCFSTFFWSDVGVTYILYACICQAFMLLFPLMLDFLTCDGSTRLQLYCLHKKQVSGEMNVVALIPALVYQDSVAAESGLKLNRRAVTCVNSHSASISKQ